MENKAFETPAAISKTIYKYLKKAIIEEEYLPSGTGEGLVIAQPEGFQVHQHQTGQFPGFC
jgi:hypothetical protein